MASMFLYYFAERQLSSKRYSREPSPPIFPLSKPQDSRHQSAVKQQRRSASTFRIRFSSAPTRWSNNDAFCALHESAAGTFETSRDVRSSVAIRGKTDVAWTSSFCSD